jgi:hypothetical protein
MKRDQRIDVNDSWRGAGRIDHLIPGLPEKHVLRRTPQAYVDGFVDAASMRTAERKSRKFSSWDSGYRTWRFTLRNGGRLEHTQQMAAANIGSHGRYVSLIELSTKENPDSLFKEYLRRFELSAVSTRSSALPESELAKLRQSFDITHFDFIDDSNWDTFLEAIKMAHGLIGASWKKSHRFRTCFQFAGRPCDCHRTVAKLIGTLKMIVETKAAVKAMAEHQRIDRSVWWKDSHADTSWGPHL